MGKKKLIEEGKLEKHGKINEKTPREWLLGRGKYSYLPALTCDDDKENDKEPMKKRKIKETDSACSSPKKADEVKKKKKKKVEPDATRARSSSPMKSPRKRRD